MHRTLAVCAALAAALGILLIIPPMTLSNPVPGMVPQGWYGTGTGGLHVFTGGQIETRDFPLKHTRVNAEVSGPVTRVEVTQVFQNPYTDTIEAIYVFPLPHEAAVTDLEMRLGERVIRGIVERREEARRIYEEARDTGRVAALLEEERPNIFTQSVANILPGNEIEITLTYVETLDYESGAYEFVFPMVVGPRFIPGAQPDAIVPAGGRLPAPSVPDADRLNPPFLPPEIRSGHDIEVAIELDAGLPVRDMRSSTHAVQVTRDGKSRARVALNPLDTIPNKDFVLRYRVDGEEPETGVLTHHDGENGYLTVLVHPKVNLRPEEITAKEMIFVVDCSGSMSGEPIAAAKTLVRHAIRNMNPSDTFQIIRFSTSASGFSPAPVAGTPEDVRRGIAYIDRLQGSGGTMMIEGIKAALDTRGDPDRIRIVMFLTDGYIGNENEILGAVRDRIGGARLFSFGVGSSVNRFLLASMAEEGRGEVQYVLPGSNAQEEVSKFYDRIRNPYLTDVELAWSGVEVSDVYPARVPDLFHGKPLVVHSRYENAGRGQLEIRGKIAGRPWIERIELSLPGRESGYPALGSLWARARIADLERSMLRGEEPATVEQITELGLSHHLVTKYTSFVAVEESLVVSDGPPRTVRVPVEMPEGVSHEGIFGERGAPVSPGGFFPMGGSNAKGNGVLMMRSFGVQGGAHHAYSAPQSYEVSEASKKVISLEGEATDPRGVFELLSASNSGLDVKIAADRSELSPGETLVLTVTFTNRSSAPVQIPDTLELGGTGLRLRVIDGLWSETSLGTGSKGVPTSALSPGASATRTLELNLGQWGVFKKPGVYHLILDGTSLAARDSNRVTIRIALR